MGWNHQPETLETHKIYLPSAISTICFSFSDSQIKALTSLQKELLESKTTLPKLAGLHLEKLMGWKLEERWVSNFFGGVSFRPLILYSFLLSVSGRELGPHFPNGLNFRGQKVWSPNCVSPQRCAIHGETPRFFGVAIQGKRNKRGLLGNVTTVYPLVSSFFEDQDQFYILLFILQKGAMCSNGVTCCSIKNRCLFQGILQANEAEFWGVKVLVLSWQDHLWMATHVLTHISHIHKQRKQKYTLRG